MTSKNSVEDLEKNVWRQISLPTALSDQHRDQTHVAHCMLWFRSHPVKFRHFTYALIQLRFDGMLGFPGGIVDEDITSLESIINALERELKEEVNYCDSIDSDDYVYSYLCEEKAMISHFFAKEIPKTVAEQVEKTFTQAHDFPYETLGIMRIPIGCGEFTKSSPYVLSFIQNFMAHKFVGISKKQMIDVCEMQGIMDTTVLAAAKKMIVDKSQL